MALKSGWKVVGIGESGRCRFVRLQNRVAEPGRIQKIRVSELLGSELKPRAGCRLRRAFRCCKATSVRYIYWFSVGEMSPLGG